VLKYKLVQIIFFASIVYNICLGKYFGSEGVNKEDGGAVGRSDLDRRPTPVCLVRAPVEGAEPVWLCRVAAAEAGGVHVSWW